MSKSTVSTLGKELSESLNVLGEDGVISALQKARSIKLPDTTVTFVLTTVCGQIGIPVSHLGDPKVKNDHKKVARGFCVYFFCDLFKDNYLAAGQKIPQPLGKKAIFESYHLIKKANILKPKSDIDKLIASNIESLTQIIKNHIETNGKRN